MMPIRRGVLLALAIVSISCLTEGGSDARNRIGTIRNFLLPYRGKEISIIDNTSGTEQFVNGDPEHSYVVTLKDVQSDFMIVERTTENDKRTMLYPLSVICRVLYKFDNQPYVRIVVELY